MMTTRRPDKCAGKAFGNTIETTVSVDAELIGGVKITVGDTVIDGSVQRDLQAMKNQLRA